METAGEDQKNFFNKQKVSRNNHESSWLVLF